MRKEGPLCMRMSEQAQGAAKPASATSGKRDASCVMGRIQEEDIGMAQPNINVISTVSAGGLTDKGEVDSAAVSFLVDTGSALTLIRKEVWDTFSSARSLTSWDDQRLVSIDGTSLQVSGQCQVELSVGGKKLTTRVIVADGLLSEGIWGLDMAEGTTSQG